MTQSQCPGCTVKMGLQSVSNQRGVWTQALLTEMAGGLVRAISFCEMQKEMFWNIQAVLLHYESRHGVCTTWMEYLNDLLPLTKCEFIGYWII